MSNNEETNNFQVVHHAYSPLEAITEAKRCLHCRVPQCVKGCPIGNHIPDFIHELSKRQYRFGDGGYQRDEQPACNMRQGVPSRETVPGALYFSQEAASR